MDNGDFRNFIWIHYCLKTDYNSQAFTHISYSVNVLWLFKTFRQFHFRIHNLLTKPERFHFGFTLLRVNGKTNALYIPKCFEFVTNPGKNLSLICARFTIYH